VKKLHSAWIVLGVTFLCLLVSAATRATPSIPIVPLEREFGWSHTVISMAISVNRVGHTRHRHHQTTLAVG